MSKKIRRLLTSFLERNQESSIVKICENAGIMIIEAEIRDVEGICVSFFGDKFIVVNDSLSLLSKDFVIGHELGHAEVHDEDLLYLKKNALFSSDKLEYEADCFSVYLLNALNKEYEIESEMDLEIIKKINKIIYK